MMKKRKFGTGGMPSMKALGKVREDIVDRDRADIDKGYRGSRVYKTSMGDVPLYPNEFGKLSKTDKMAYRDAVRRENRRGDNWSLAEELGIKGETGKGISRTEGDATRKRLIEKYAKEAPASKMPSSAESAASGNRVSEQVGKETKKLMPATRSTRPSVGDAIASGNRMSKKNAEDLKAVKKYAKGGKVKKRYADGDLVMGGAASDTSGLSLGMPSIDTDLRRALTDKELMDANLAAVRAREAVSMAKPKPKAPAPTKKAEAPVKKPAMSTAKEDKEIVVTGKRPQKPAVSNTAAREKQITEERRDSFFKRPLTPAETRAEASKKPVPAPSVTRGYADRGARTLTDREKRVAKNAATEAARSKKPNIFQRMYDMTVNPGVDKKYAKGGVTRADGCAVRGKTKGKMV